MQQQTPDIVTPKRAAARTAGGSWNLARLRAAGRGALPLLALWLVAALGVTLIYLPATATSVDIGHSYARPHLEGFFDDEAQGETTYAYSGARAAVILPGSGGGSAIWSIRFNGWRPEGVAPAEVTLRPGHGALSFAPPTVPTVYHVFLPAGSGDARVGIETNTFQPANDQRNLGIPLEAVSVQPLSGTPAWTTLGLLLLLAAALWLFGRRVGMGPWAAALLALAPLLALLAGLWSARMLITVGLTRWVVVAALLHLLLGPLQWLTAGTLRRHELAVAPRTWHWLWAIFGVALLFKLGGVLYPHIRVFDEAAHTGRVRALLDGHFADLYFPNYTSFMGATVGIEGGYFPYSPLWYLISAPLALIGLPIGDAMNGLNAILDVTKGLMIFVIALRVTRRERLALLAAALYHLLPMPYYLLSWGNYPTQFGLWAALLATTFLVLNYQRMLERRTMIWWIALLALSILSYTVIGVFAWTMFGLIALRELMRGKARQPKVVKAILLGMLAAELFAFAIYHVQFAEVIVTNTLPSLMRSAGDKADAPLAAAGDARANPLDNIAENTGFMRNHLTDALLLLSIIGIAYLYVNPATRPWWVLWTAWIAVFVLYALVSAFVADMVLKHIFFIMPLICLALALLADTFWERSRAGRWVVAAGTLALMAVVAERWYFYLLIKRH